jgi:hypothetical protein
MKTKIFIPVFLLLLSTTCFGAEPPITEIRKVEATHQWKYPTSSPSEITFSHKPGEFFSGNNNSVAWDENENIFYVVKHRDPCSFSFIRLWNTFDSTSLDLRPALKPLDTLQIHPIGKLIGTSRGHYIEIVSLQTYKKRSIPCQTYNTIRWHPTKLLLAILSQTMLKANTTLTIYNYETDESKEIVLEEKDVLFIAPHQLAWHPSEDLIAVSAKDNSIKIFDTTTGRLSQTLLGQKYSRVSDIEWSPCGNYIASTCWNCHDRCRSNSWIQVWRVATDQIWSVETNMLIFEAHNPNLANTYFPISWSPSGEYLAFANGTPKITLLHMPSQETFELDDHLDKTIPMTQERNMVAAMKWHLSKKQLAIFMANGTIIVQATSFLYRGIQEESLSHLPMEHLL